MKNKQTNKTRNKERRKKCSDHCVLFTFFFILPVEGGKNNVKYLTQQKK